MIERRPSPWLFLVLAGAWLACTARCAPAQGFDEAAGKLRACPQGDGPWREAVFRAEEEGRLEDLASLLEELETTCVSRWEPRWAAGGLAMAERELETARERFESALELARSLDDHVGIARSADDAAWCAYLGGALTHGEALYLEALEAAERAGRDDLRSFIQGNLAGLLVERGRIAEARDRLDASIAGLERLGLAEEARNAGFNQAVLELELGNALGAERRLVTILEEARARGDRGLVDECAVVLGNLHFAMDEHEEARRWYSSVSADDRAVSAMASVGRGRSMLMQGEVPGAREHFERALSLARGVDEPVARVAGAYLAEALRLEGDAAAALRRAEGVLAELGEDDPEESAWLARVVLARALAEQGRAGEAERVLVESVSLIAEQSAELDPLQEGLRFFRERRLPALALAEHLALVHQGAAAERILELSFELKARALRRVLERGVSPTFPPLDAIRGALGEGDVLIDLLVADRAVIATVVTREGTRVEVIPLDRLAMRSVAQKLREELVAGEAARASLRWFSENLLRELSPLIEGSVRVYFVPDGVLSLVPLEALEIEEGRLFAEEYELVLLPYAAPPPRWESLGSGEVLLAGHPRFSGDEGHEELPWAALELSRLEETWAASSHTMLVREAFLPRALLEALPGKGLVHVASHAEASTRDPRLCGLVCSEGRRVGLDEISSLNLGEPLVVLSACRTGQGEIIPGEGVLGLGWAFLSAGARGLVTSRWSVEDAGSARLMIAFHERLAKGVGPVEALADAKREAIAEGASPAMWGAYVLTLNPAGRGER